LQLKLRLRLNQSVAGRLSGALGWCVWRRVRRVPRVTFTSNLARLVDAPALVVSGATVREALEAVFARNPRLRGYVLDDQGGLRRHVVVFVGGETVVDRTRLTDPVDEKSEISVLQALSGG
jgi:hypothetical protein